MTAMPSALALGSLAYQTVWVVSITFVLWFALILRYSASRLSAFTFLTPLFGVAAGNLVLDEPITPAFAAAVVLVVAGLVLVNRPPRDPIQIWYVRCRWRRRWTGRPAAATPLGVRSMSAASPWAAARRSSSSR